MSEQYSLRWNQVDLERRQLHIWKTKTGQARIIPLSDTATKTFTELRNASARPGTLFFPSIRTGDALQGSRGWFGSALEAAEIKDSSW